MAETAGAVGVEVAEHFHSEHQQRHATTFGMWAWLITELLLFAGLFLVALILRLTHPAEVVAATRHLKFWIGAANTAILICSSLTMSGAIQASRLGRQRATVRFMVATAGFGGAFLCLKGFEYYQDYLEHMVPFLSGPYALASMPASILYVDLYFAATGLHGLHLLTGVAIMLVLARQACAPGYLSRHQNRVEVYGLYWHFIDLIWMIVFTSVYAMNR